MGQCLYFEVKIIFGECGEIVFKIYKKSNIYNYSKNI